VAKYGDIIAHKTGLGGLWVGVFLAALVTSLPEFFTGVSAITLVGAPDLTIGNLFAANSFNLLNLAILDIVYHNSSLLRVASPTHRLTAWFSVVLVFIAAASIFASRFSPPVIGWVGLYTPLIIILYVVFIRIILRREQQPSSPQASEQEATLDYGGISLKKTYLYFALSAIFIIGAGIWLAMIGKEVAVVTGWGESFVGSLLLGFTTSLPEITVSFAAMRIGAVDLAVANMIGSNLFNMTIIPVDDLLYLPGSVLASVSETHLVTTLVVMVMTVMLIAGLRFNPKKLFRLSWWNVTMIVLFSLGAYFNFVLA